MKDFIPEVGNLIKALGPRFVMLKRKKQGFTAMGLIGSQIVTNHEDSPEKALTKLYLKIENAKLLNEEKL